MFRDLTSLAEGAGYDIVVVGAGAGGMAAAVFAATAGRSVLVVERTDYVGGTSALSAATTGAACTSWPATRSSRGC